MMEILVQDLRRSRDIYLNFFIYYNRRNVHLQNLFQIILFQLFLYGFSFCLFYFFSFSYLIYGCCDASERSFFILKHQHYLFRQECLILWSFLIYVISDQVTSVIQIKLVQLKNSYSSSDLPEKKDGRIIQIRNLYIPG